MRRLLLDAALLAVLGLLVGAALGLFIDLTSVPYVRSI